jgi:CelD/BcsL family acetyltransferase involved in cellulose biosynthesis
MGSERGLRVLCQHGVDGVTALGPGWEQLADATEAPVTASWSWLSTWARTHPSWRPLAISVQDDERSVAAALLAYRRWGPLVDLVAMGHGQSDYARFPALDTEAEGVLAEAMLRAIRGLGRALRLRLDGVPPGDPVVAQVVAALPGVDVRPAEGAPMVRFTSGVDPAQSGRREARVTVRRGRNRLRSDGRTAAIECTTDVERVAVLLPELEQIHRVRDRAVRGRSDMDDPEDRSFWYAICTQAAAEGRLELSTLRIDGELAAYVLAFQDGQAYRVWDPRIAPSFSRYNPGHLLRSEILSRVAAEGRFTVFDWMRGEERYKLATTSTVEPLERVVGWSPAILARWEPAARRLLGRPLPGAKANR